MYRAHDNNVAGRGYSGPRHGHQKTGGLTPGRFLLDGDVGTGLSQARAHIRRPGGGQKLQTVLEFP